MENKENKFVITLNSGYEIACVLSSLGVASKIKNLPKEHVKLLELTCNEIKSQLKTNYNINL